MLKKIKCSFNLANNSQDILNASKIILPGVGSFDNGVKALKAKGLFEPLIEKANIGTPLLGICLGILVAWIVFKQRKWFSCSRT